MKLNPYPIPFFFLAILGLLAALWAGLMRLGWQLPALTPSLAILHGPVMISGFLGTLITLERAVAIKQKWMYLPPLLSGLGWLVATILPKHTFGVILLTLASLGGFVISMIFGHAPIIFPAILGIPINFQPVFYIHLGLLHISLFLRVIADYANFFSLRMWGGLLNEFAILIFIGVTISSVRKSIRYLYK